MSEKKTAEIKLRIEPSRKARYQQAAADDGISLSEWTTKNNDDALWAKQNQQIDGLSLVGNAIASIDNSLWVEDTYAPSGDVITLKQTGEVVQVTAVPTSEGEKKFGSEWKPWEA